LNNVEIFQKINNGDYCPKCGEKGLMVTAEEEELFIISHKIECPTCKFIAIAEEEI
jgi:predicted RNA-binding Zn-ribbon protein involved in translation (DUF1610 family)